MLDGKKSQLGLGDKKGSLRTDELGIDP